jgi:cysteinyl-tRNA synthetase
MKIYNTISRKKEEFIPSGDEVKMYVCGITPYDDAHIGHAMSYIIFDVIRRYFQFSGYKTKYIQNITDIDDKIIDRANKLGMPAKELAEKYISSFLEDMRALNIIPADEYPRATEEISSIIEVGQTLVDKGHAYSANGSVYFRIKSFTKYGKLSHRSPDSMISGIRIEANEEKEHSMDFVLWKASKPGEPAWPSPWGEGRPGWHIECSAMSLKHLGETFDIHGGGQDLIFPHHENEIAQSECVTGKPFVRYWLHNGLLRLGEEKMSKSLGNLVTIKEAMKRYSVDALRIFILSSHYRNPLTYSEEALEAAEKGAERLRQSVQGKGKEGRGKRIDIQEYRSRFTKAMDNDFGTPQAMASLFDLAKEINRTEETGNDATEARNTLKELAHLMGLTLERKEVLPFDATSFIKLKENMIASARQARLDEVNNKIEQATREPENDDIKGQINSLMSLRDILREHKQFQLADEIRTKLAEMGIALEDTTKGTLWKYRC